MATQKELQGLANLRLREADALFAAGLYDGWVYLCGYVVEVALKATICATLSADEYPDGRLKGAFKTHDFEDLKLLAGMEKEFSASNPAAWANWSVATEWEPAWRYKPEGSHDRAYAEAMLNAIRIRPNGVLACLSSRW